MADFIMRLLFRDFFSKIRNFSHEFKTNSFVEENLSIDILFGVVAQWCNPLTLKPEQSGGVGSRRDRASPLERHDKGSRTRLALSYFSDPSAWR